MLDCHCWACWAFAPSVAVRFEVGGGAFVEGSRLRRVGDAGRDNAASLIDGVNARPNELPRFRRRVPSRRKGHIVERPQAHIPAAFGKLEPQDPTLAAAGRNMEVKSLAVTVQAGLIQPNNSLDRECHVPPLSQHRGRIGPNIHPNVRPWFPVV